MLHSTYIFFHYFSLPILFQIICLHLIKTTALLIIYKKFSWYLLIINFTYMMWEWYWQLEFSSCKTKVFVERKNKPSGTIERHIYGQRFQKMGQAFSGIYTSELASICVLSAFHTFFFFSLFQNLQILKEFSVFLNRPNDCRRSQVSQRREWI